MAVEVSNLVQLQLNKSQKPLPPIPQVQTAKSNSKPLPPISTIISADPKAPAATPQVEKRIGSHRNPQGAGGAGR